MNVFLSSGTPYTDEQEAFLSGLEAVLRKNGCEPMTVGRTEFSVKQPIQSARDLMRQCDGAVVLAFTRYALSGTEFPESERSKQVAFTLPTVWNQLEAALAYGCDLPLLILTEADLKRQGMLSDRSEWFPHEVDLAPATFDTVQFRGVLRSWLEMVEERATQPAPRGVEPGSLTIGQLARDMTPAQMWKVLGALLTLLAGVASAAYWLGQNTPRSDALSPPPSSGTSSQQPAQQPGAVAPSKDGPSTS